MNALTRFMLVALTAGVSLWAIPSRAETVSTPIAAPVQLGGQAGGTVSSSCGNIPSTPQHQLQVRDPFTSLRFRVSSAPSSTLMVRQPNGGVLCIMADPHSGATLELPGLWDAGRYEIYVGDQGNARPPFQLEIVPE